MIQLAENNGGLIRKSERERGVSSFIPYACHYDAETLLAKNGQLIQIIKLDGLPFESADASLLDFKKMLRNTLFKSLAGLDYVLWFHTIRTRQPAYPFGDFLPGFAGSLNERWRSQNDRRQLFENKLYISIVKRGPTAANPTLSAFFGGLLRLNEKQTWDDGLKKRHQDLKDVSHKILTALSDYGARLLTTEAAVGGTISEPLAFLSRLINLSDRKVKVPETDLSRYLTCGRLFFGHHALEWRGMTDSRFAAMVSIKEYGPETAAGLLDSLFSLPFEFVLTQSFVFHHRQDAVARLRLQQRRLEQSEDPSISQTDAIDHALDETSGGAIAFGEHHLTIQPIAQSLVDLQEALARIDAELMNIGAIGVREDINLEPAFWAQLPGNFQFIARRATLSTLNLASFASLHNYPVGQATDNHWGPAVTLLETQSTTPYFFNFHRQDVGHTTVIGPTGCGKTAILNFLCAQAMKFSGRLIYFDRDRGSEIFIRALNGRYAVLTPAEESHFNPLQLPDSEANRSFLSTWLESLLTTNGERLSDDDRQRITEAVDGNYRLLTEQRTLANIMPFLGMPGSGGLANRLRAWCLNGPYSKLFGSSTDSLSLNPRVLGFEMGGLIQNEVALGPVLLYLFHRINSFLDGTPTLIVLEEAWSLLKSKVFAEKMEDWLKTFRKRNAAVVFSTQSAEDAIQSPISPTLIGMTATHLYFANPKATDEYRNAFQLSERELDLLRRDLNPKDRYFLLKHGRESVVARADLSQSPEFLGVLSGTATTLRLCDRLRREKGNDSTAWLPHFQKEILDATTN